MREAENRPASLSPARWRTLEPLLDAALDLPPERRAEFLDAKCGADVAMRHELMQMLMGCERPVNASPVGQLAAERFASLWVEEKPDDAPQLQAALADRYTLEREAGRGGAAIVYRARDLRHQRLVALKVLRTALPGQGLARFRREIALAANLQHPHILPVFDSGESAGRLWYTMPFIEGESLGARLRREQWLEVPEAMRLLREIADGLDHAHARGVVHRDLKPDNILLSGEHAIIADFGIAKAFGGATNGDAVDANADNVSTRGMSVGTPTYMSPEQAAGDPGVDQRADLYALGVIAYQLFAGVTPFTGTSPRALLTAHLTERPAPISTHRRDVPPGVERLVMQLLEKYAVDRPRSAAAVLAELDAAEGAARDTKPASSAAPNHMKRMPSASLRWMLVTAVVALGAGAATWVVRARHPLSSVPRALVIPFENASGDTSIAYLGRAASEWIAEGLAKSRVVDVATGTLLPGSSPVSALRTAPLALLKPLGNQVLAILASRLDPRSAEWSMGATPSNIEAYNAHFDGLDLMSQGDFRGALAHWDRAAALDSTYVQPLLSSMSARVNLGEWSAAESLVVLVERRSATLTPGDRAMLDFHRAYLDGHVGGALDAAQALVKAEPGAQLPYYFVELMAVRSSHPKMAIEAAKHVAYRSGRYRYSWAGGAYFGVLTSGC